MTLIALSLSIEIGREGFTVQSLFQRTRIAWSDVATITIATNFLGGYMLALVPGSGRGNVIGVVCFLSGRPSFATKAVLSAALTANPSIELHGAHPHFGTPPYSLAQVRELFDSDVSVRERV